jgi:hypothetical protein
MLANILSFDSLITAVSEVMFFKCSYKSNVLSKEEILFFCEIFYILRMIGVVFLQFQQTNGCFFGYNSLCLDLFFK